MPFEVVTYKRCTWSCGRVAGWLLLAAGSLCFVGVSASLAQGPREGLSKRQAARHVLDRLAFGPAPGEVQAVVEMGWQQWVRRQLKPSTIDNEACNRYLREHFPSLGMTMDQVFAVYRPSYGDDPPTKEQTDRRNLLRYRAGQELVGSVVYRAVNSDRRFEEVMAEFWRNHFNVDQGKDELVFLAANYEQTVIRRHLFGRFSDMLLASARHPAMLIYLDNDVSQKPLTDREQQLVTRFEGQKYQPSSVARLGRQRGLNENYAREVMELHTLGVSGENRRGGYYQRDVTELARLLTGWTAGRTGDSMSAEGGGYGFRFNSEVHDDRPKEVAGMRFNGREGEAGGVRFLLALADHPRTARFISMKLCRYLVSDDPPEALVDEVAKVFVDTHGDLSSVYEAILFSDAFMDPANYRAKFRTPFEFVTASLRATDAELTGFGGTLDALRRMGQPVYRCVDPTGYYDTAEAWLDPGVLVYRWDYALRLSRDRVPGVRIPETFWRSLPKGDPDGLKRALAEALLGEGAQGEGWAALNEAMGKKPKPRLAAGLVLGSPMFQQQ
jgi:uncharacterized protein (DUF1800 family)